jgi:RNA polymerase sigma-70 factor (ECF subfamily)
MPDRKGTTMAAERVDGPASDDSELASALMRRDSRAARQAWSLYSPLVLRFLRRFFGPGPDRQDMCQEVFLRFFKRIDELRNPGSLRGFLLSISLGVARNELRRVRIRRWVMLTPAGDVPEVPVSGWDPEAREATAHLYSVLERVSGEDRSLFVTRYVEKMEIADIAAIHGLTFGTAKRRLERATRRISAKMNRDPLLEEYVGRLREGRSSG